MALPEAVDSYVKSISLKKKSFGGVDETDALTHMREICILFQRELEAVKEENEQLEQDLANAREECVRAVAAAKKASTGVSEDAFRAREEALRAKDEEIAELKRALDTAKASPGSDEAEAMKREYEEKYNEIKDLSEFIGTIKAEAAAKAEAEAASIRNNAIAESEEIRRTANEERETILRDLENARQQKAEFQRDMAEASGKFSDSLRTMRLEMDSLIERLKEMC